MALSLFRVPGEAPGLRDLWPSVWSGRRRAWEHNYTLNEGFLLLK